MKTTTFFSKAQLLLMLLLSFYATPPLSAQELLWGRRGGGTNVLATGRETRVMGSAIDSHDNVYVLARVGPNNLRVHNTVIPTFNNALQEADILLTSFTKNGDVRWSKVLGGDLEDTGLNLKVDGNDNVYVSGRAMASGNLNQPPVHFDLDTILPLPVGLNVNRKVVFIIKYDNLGQYQWLSMPEPDTVRFGIDFNGFGLALDIDPSDNIHWLTYLRPGLHSWQGHNALISQEGYYILRYRPNGTVYNVIQLPIESELRFFGDLLRLRQKLVYDPIHHRYLLGGTLGQAGMDSVGMVLGNDTINDRAYLIAMDTLGQPQWHVTGSANPGDISFRDVSLNDVKIDSLGNIYVCGNAADYFTFNGTSIRSFGPAISPYIFKLTSTGTNVWGKMASVIASSEAAEMAIFEDEIGLLCHSTSKYWQGQNDFDTLRVPQGHLVRPSFSVFDRFTGDLKLIQEVSVGSFGFGFSQSVCVDSEGAYYLSGSFSNLLFAGPDTLGKVGGQRSFFLTKFVCAPPSADFSVSYPDLTSPVFAYSGSRADSLFWEFGDGQTASGDSVAHTYAATGWYEVCVTAFTKCGQATFCDSIPSDALSTTASLSELSWRVYPNPANEKLIIHYNANPSQSINGQVHTIQGTALYQWQSEGNQLHEVNTSEWPSGVYIITVQTHSGAILHKRVVVQH